MLKDFPTGYKSLLSSTKNKLFSLTGSAKNVGAFALSLAKAHPVIAGVTTALTAGTAAVTIYKKKQKEAAQEIENAYNKAKETIDNISSSMENKETTVESIGKEYAELAQGVNQITGENLTLNISDYERFLSLSNQLADLFPTLERNYRNGNAIVQLSGDIDTIVESLQNLIKAQQDLSNSQIAENIPELFEGVLDNSKEYIKEINKQKDKRNGTQKSLDIINDYDILHYIDKLSNGEELKFDTTHPESLGDTNTDAGNLRTILNEAISNAGLNRKAEIIKDNHKLDTAIGVSLTITGTDDEIEEAKTKIKTELEALIGEYNTTISNCNQKINTLIEQNKENWSSMLSSVIAYVSTDSSYKIMSDELQTSIQNVINNINWAELSSNFKSWDDAESFIKDKLIGLFQGEDSVSIKTALSDANEAQSQFLNGDISLKKYQDSINTFKTLIKDADTEVQEAFNRMFTITTEDGFSTDALLNNTKDKFKNITSDLENHIGELSLSDLQIAANLDIPNGTLNTWNELLDKIEEVKAKLSVPADLPYEESLAQIHSMSSGLSQLSSIYADVNDKGEFEWSSILNNENFKNTFGELGTTYDDFIKTVSSAPDDIEACQTAFDNLSGSFVSKKISYVTEETKDATIAFLEQNNIKNAKPLVEQTLKDKQNAYDFVTNDLNMTIREFNDETYESQNALLAQAGAAETCRHYLLNLQLQEIASSDNPLNVNGKIESLKNLALAYGIADTAAEKMANRQKEADDYEKRTGANTGIHYTKADYKHAEDDFMSKIEEKFNNILNVEYGTPPTTTSDTSEDTVSSKDSATSLFDFLELRLSRLKSKTQNIINQITDYTTTALKRTLLNNSISSIFDEIDAQVQAYSRYMAKAESIALDETLKEKVRDGSLEVDYTLTEEQSEALTEYQNWYEKALAAQEEINSLKTEELNKVKELAELEATIYQHRINILDYNKEYNNQYISIQEAMGRELYAADYQDVIDNNLDTQDYLVKQIQIYKELAAKLDSASDAYHEVQEKIQELTLSYRNLEKENVELTKTINELPVQKIQSWLDYLDTVGKEYKSLVSYRQQLGVSLSKSHYQEQINNNLQQIKSLEEQSKIVHSLYITAQNARNLTAQREYSKQYHEIQSSIYNLKAANDELKDSMRDDIYWWNFEKAHTVTQKLADNLQSLNSMIDDDSLFDDNGKLTRNGNAKVALYLKQYETAKEEIVNYMKDLNNAFKLNYQGMYTTDEYNEKLTELQKGLLEASGSVKSFADSLTELYIKQGQAEVDALNELIKSRTEALNKKKEYYDYDKTIRTKSKDIQALETQKAALEATEDTLEKRRKLLELEEQLQEKRDDLEDTKYDHEINLIVNGLDDFTEDIQERFDTYSDNLQNSLEMQTDIINNANKMYADSYGKVQQVLDGILRSYGIDTSQALFNTSALLGSATTAQLMESFFKINSPDYTISNPQTAGNVINCDVTFDFKTDKTSVQDFEQMIPDITDKVSSQLAKNLKKIGY